MAAHQGFPMAAVAPTIEDTDDGSGATQALATLHVGAAADPRAGQPPGEGPAAAAPAPPPGLLQEPLAEPMLAELIEHEILSNFEIVQAARRVDGQTVVPRSLDSRSEFTLALKSLAYNPAAADAWSILGLSPLEGPDLSLNTIGARFRFAKLLASMIDTAPWPPADRAEAHEDIAKITQAATTCFSSFDSWLRERRRARPSKLPLWHDRERWGMTSLRPVLTDTF